MNPNYPNQGYPQQPGMYTPQGQYPQGPVKQYTVSFGQAISRAFSNYATFTGRASRSEFWWWMLFCFLVSLIPTILMVVGLISSAAAASYSDYGSAGSGAGLSAGIGLIGLVLVGIFNLALIIPSLAIVWRRLHDTGRSGALYLLIFIPFLNFIWEIVLLVWFCTGSQPYDNAYGPVPNRVDNNKW